MFLTGVKTIFGIVASLILTASNVASKRLDVIDLPDGFVSGGITNGEGWTAYVGSVADGSIWKGDLSTGEGEVVLAGRIPYDYDVCWDLGLGHFFSGAGCLGTSVTGLDHDRRSGYLFVAGGYTGIRVYNDQFDVIVEYNLREMNGGTESFVNDVVVTETAAYFTGALEQIIYTVRLNGEDGELLDGPEQALDTIILEDEVFPFTGEGMTASGIQATEDGKMLIVGHETHGGLFTVDPATGDVKEISLDGGFVMPDGMVLRKNTLWLLYNGRWRGVPRITEISLSLDRTCGFVAQRKLNSDLFNNPTKMMRKGNSFYVVNTKFEDANQGLATTPYEIVRVDRDDGQYECPEEE